MIDLITDIPAMHPKGKMETRNSRETIRRQFEMLRMLKRTAKLSPQDLRKRLEAIGYKVTDRTVQRDLRDLSLVFPIVSDEETKMTKPYGWSWDPSKPVCNLGGLTTPEALAFQMLARFGKNFLPAGFSDILQPYFREANEQLNETIGTKETGNWGRKIRSVPPNQPLLTAEISPRVQENVHAALMKNCALMIQYRTAKAKQAVIHPLGLVEHGKNFYLVARYDDFDDIRLLAMHRIKSTEILGARPAVAPDGFDLDSYIADGAMGFGEIGKSGQVKIKFSNRAGKHLNENQLSNDQKIIDLGDGEIIVTATVNLTERLRWWLLGFGGDVEVIEPEELRKDIRARLERALARYQ